MSDRHAPDTSANNVADNTNSGDTNGEILDDNDEGSAPEQGDAADSNVEDDGEDNLTGDGEGDVADGEADDGNDVDEGGDQGGDLTRRSRKPNAYAALRQRAQKSETQLAELQRQLDQVRSQPNAVEIQRRQDEYRAWFATLTPVEQAEQRGKEIEQRTARQLQAIQFRLEDQGDRQSFEAKARTNPLYARYQNRVEEFLTNARSQNRNHSRQDVMTFLIGQDALRKAETTGTRRANKAQAAITRETTRPGNNRGDATARSGRDRNADTPAGRKARLSGAQI